MDEREFRRGFLDDVRAEALVTGEGSCASFVSAFASRLQDADYLFDFTSSFFEGYGKSRHKLRVDGYSFDELDKTMSLVIADFDATDDYRTLTKSQVKQLQKRLEYFVAEALDEGLRKSIEVSRPSSDLVDLLREKRKETRKYNFFVFTSAKISDSIGAVEADDIDGVPCECQIWDLARLYMLCAASDGRHIIEINFKEYAENGIPCVEASATTCDHFKSYLCILPGTALADLYDQHGSALLEGNVRSFLSTKVAVNKNIRSTILHQPDRFFAYNNGISATAMDVSFERTANGLFLISARDLQIINGGQTTASLSSARFKDKADLGTIFVQMKLTVIERDLKDDAVTALVQSISRSSNSQNKVSDADFFSTHPFHIQMERCSQRLGARATGGLQFETRWFYERARGQYLQKQMRMTPSEKKKFMLQNPKEQLITKTDLAKVRNTWDGKPHIVSKGAQSNFVEFAQRICELWEKDGGLLFGDSYFQESVALCLLFRFTERMIPRQAWYQQGYRANIVTYSIALLRCLIRKQHPNTDLNLLLIWKKQRIPNVVERVLTELSELVYARLTDPKREVENVTQWCKREACWKSVLGIDYLLPTGIGKCLLGQAELNLASKEAQEARRYELEAEAITKVAQISADEWLRVASFATTNDMVTDDENAALHIACQLPVKVPTAAQSKKLLVLLNRLYEEGFSL